MEKVKAVLKLQHELRLRLEAKDNLKDILSETLDFLLEIEEFEGGGVYVKDHKNGDLNLVFYKSLPDDLITGFSHYDSKSPQAAIVSKGKHVYSNYEEIRNQLKDKPFKSNIEAIAILPLIYKEDVVGAINLASFTIKYYSKETQMMLEAFSDILSSIIGRNIAQSENIKSKNTLKSYLENAPHGIFITDKNGTYVDVNETATTITGYSKKELIGMRLFDLTPEKSIDSVKNSFMRLQETGKTRNETPFIRKNGSEGIWEVNAAKLSENTFIGFAIDITEQKKLEERLLQQEKMEAVGQLAGGVAHDFNNQLACILGNTDLLHRELEGNSKLSIYTNNILKSTKHAKDLIFQLLAFARKGNRQCKSLDVEEIIMEAVTLLKHSIDKRIKLVQEFNANTSIILGDPSQLENVFLNIAINARDAIKNRGEIKFTTETVTLTDATCSRLTQEVKQGDYLKVLISDTGSGISKNIQEHIFEPFFTTKEQGKGTGMGLAAAYGTVKSHKGLIDVTSKIGQGTTFEIYLPISEVKQNNNEEESYTCNEIVKQKGNILLVDDEDLVLQLTEQMLKRMGYEVTPCLTAESAINHLESNKNLYDLIVLDMIMPDMNGKETFRKMKEINGNINVLLASGFSMDGDTQSTLDEGAIDFIQKPFFLDELSEKILRILN